MNEQRIFQINVSHGGVPKRAVAKTLVSTSGAEDDDHDDKQHHGGPRRALCLYSLELILALQAEGHTIFPGSAGENITLIGVDWSLMAPGARLRIGEHLEIELTDYASPCSTIHESFVSGYFNRISENKHPGWSRLLARVLRPGAVRVGDRVTLA